MRILIYGTNYLPELTGIGKYSGEMAEWLVGRGHEVRVVTAPPYYPAWRVSDGFSCYRFRRENVNGVNVWRCPLWVPAQPTGFKRLLHLASFAISSAPVLLRQAFWRPEVVVVVEPPLVCAPAALLVACIAGARSWLHVQDFEVDAAFGLGMLPRSGLLYAMISSAERFLMHRFDRVSSISANMVALLKKKGVDPERCVLFQNWVDTEEIRPLPDQGRLRREFSIPTDKIVALYSGNMGMKQGLNIILEAAESLAENPSLHFVLCGEGAAKSQLIEKWGTLKNVSWLTLQPVHLLNDLLNMADMHLLPQSRDVADLVMPSKIAGMFASGHPVVATAHPGTQLAEVVEGRGLVSPPGDAKKFAEAIEILLRNPGLRAELGEKARAYAVRNLSKDVSLKYFESGLLEMSPNAPSGYS